MKLEFNGHILKNTNILNFMKIRPVGAEFLADGRTDEQSDTTKLLFDIRSFANAPKK
jgi:hypothetical protein